MLECVCMRSALYSHMHSYLHLSVSVNAKPLLVSGSRQSDRGPDNLNKTTHAAHATFVREGVWNVMEWTAGMSGHSHGGQDKTFADTRSTFYPGQGSKGIGCNSPFDYCDKMLNSPPLANMYTPPPHTHTHTHTHSTNHYLCPYNFLCTQEWRYEDPAPAP